MNAWSNLEALILLTIELSLLVWSSQRDIILMCK